MNYSLSGRTVLVPDGASATSGALAALVEAGARPLVVPLIEARTLPDPAPLDASLRRLHDGAYQWLAVSSAASVRALEERAQIQFAHDPMVASLLGLVAVGNLRVAASGRSTIAALNALGIEPLAPLRGSAPVALIGPLTKHAAGASVLFARGNLVGPALAGALRGAGLTVDEVVTHITLRSEDPPPATVSAWGTGQVDAILLTSPRAVHGMIDRLGPPLAGVVVGCVDGATADAARASGVAVDTIGKLPTVRALVDALGSRFSTP